jgi:RNA polymerase sigma-70 factor (ECF subfamily)
MTVCGHREDAEDTMQDVLLKAIPYLARFDSPKALTTWLYTVARNRCWMSRRKSKFAPKEHLSLEELMPDAMELDHLGAIAAGGPSPERSVIAGQDSKQLQQAILKVPPPYRLVLVLHDVEELSTDEIARILNLKEGNVRVRLHRARLFVRKELSQLAPRPAGQTRIAQYSSDPISPLGAKGKLARSRHCKQIFANLSDYLDGALDDTLCKELERHMGGCEPCVAFLASLRNTIEETHSLPSQRPDPHAAVRVRDRLSRQLQTAATDK